MSIEEHIAMLTDMIMDSKTPEDFGTLLGYLKRHKLPLSTLETAIEHSEFIQETL